MRARSVREILAAMHPDLHVQLAKAIIAERLREAEARRRGANAPQAAQAPPATVFPTSRCAVHHLASKRKEQSVTITEAQAVEVAGLEKSFGGVRVP